MTSSPGRECWRTRTLFLVLAIVVGFPLRLLEFVQVRRNVVGNDLTSSVATMVRPVWYAPAFLHPAANLTPPKDGASILVQLEDIAGFGMIQNLYYRNGTFHMFVDGTEEERLNLTQQIESSLCGCTNMDHKDFPMRVHDYADLPRHIDHVWPGVTWVLLTSPTFIDHYFHFLEYLIGMWPMAYFTNSVDNVQNVLIGPFVDDRWMVKGKQMGINDLVLGALLPNATRWFGVDGGNNSLPVGDVWIRMDRAITGERYKPYANRVNGRMNKMSVAMTKWALEHDPFVYDHMKQRILSTLCPSDMCGYLRGPSRSRVIAKRKLGRGGKQNEVRRPRITYISRQLAGRKFTDEVSRDLDAMLLSEELAQYFEVRIVYMEKYNAVEQFRIAASTDIMLGVHGNGLTHALWMPMHGAVIEVFKNATCLYDYQWVAAASSQHWIGLTQEGVLAVGNRESYCTATGGTGWDEIIIDLDHLKTLLFTLRNTLHDEP